MAARMSAAAVSPPMMARGGVRGLNMALLRRSEPVARTRVRGQPQRAKSTSSSNNSRQQQSSEDLRAKNRNVAQIGVAVALATVGMAYASVPLYQLFCRVTG